MCSPRAAGECLSKMKYRQPDRKAGSHSPTEVEVRVLWSFAAHVQSSVTFAHQLGMGVLALISIGFLAFFGWRAMATSWYCPVCNRKVKTFSNRFCSACHAELRNGWCDCGRCPSDRTKRISFCRTCQSLDVSRIRFWKDASSKGRAATQR